MYKKIVQYHYNEKTTLRDSVQYHCRFCGQAKNAKHFKKVAHAVSEGLGNKRIITSYECDECNEQFANYEENEITRLFKFYKTLRGLKGKNGIIKEHGGNFSYTENGTFSAQIDMSKKKFDISLGIAPNGTVAPIFSKQQVINFKLVYQALVKYALSVVPESISIELEAGYKFLHEKKDFPSYTGTVLLFHEYIKNPGIAIYQRTLDAELPKYFASIDVYQVRYIIPLDFQRPTLSLPVELIGNLDIPLETPFDFCKFYYSDEHRAIIQKEQPYSKLW